MWIMLLIVIHKKNIDDIPARMTLEFPSKELCESTLSTLEYDTKKVWPITNFKVIGSCQKSS